MSAEFFDVVRYVIYGLLAGPLYAEVVGYWWHRSAEHDGWFGDAIRYRHWVHHQRDYPVGNLVRVGQYQSAHSWSWYVAAVGALLIVFLFWPFRDALPMAIGGIVYGMCLDSLHQAFHVQRHWLMKYDWFRGMKRRHCIHHYAACNYGIAFFFLDRLGGTFRDTFPLDAEPLFPNYVQPR